jgi:predicted RecA/RadA family phage recombinase
MMAQNFIQAGNHLTLPAAPDDLAPGDGAVVGSIFGVSQNASLSGEECVLSVTGVWNLVKLTTDVFAIGDPVYFDPVAKLVTADPLDTGPIGVAVTAAGNPSSTVNVRLNGVSLPA